ncbi:hypothetical protein BRDID11002_26260 [Bradyrhizobium diazoefficiens]
MAAIIVASAATADPDRDAVDLNLDHSDVGPGLASRRFALIAKNRRLRDRAYHGRHELQVFRSGTLGRGFSQLAAPTKLRR